MSLPSPPFACDNPSVNTVLHHFATALQELLGPHLLGLYLYGSLALGDFNPQTSDIDFIAVTASELSSEEIEKLRTLHANFESSDSPWASKIEAAYLPQSALNHRAPTAAQYPQVEQDRPFCLAPLEIGWPFQRYTLREHGLIILGPAPKSLINPVEPNDLRQSLTTVIDGWLDQSLNDPSWLHWLAQPEAHAFVVLTLCRSLYTLANGDVASKPASARWALATLPPRWHPLIHAALSNQPTTSPVSAHENAETLALLQYTFSQIQSS